MSKTMEDGSLLLSPEEAAKFYGSDVEAFMATLDHASRRHGMLAVCVTAFTRNSGVVSFSAGASPEWRELAQMLAIKASADVAKIVGAKAKAVDPRAARRPALKGA